MAAIDLQPHLAGEHVALRPLAAEDWDPLYAVASDPLIWAGHPAHDRWQEPVFAKYFADALASGGALVAFDPASGAVLGSSRFDPSRAGPGAIEIGWTFLARERWGGAINAEMKRLMVGHALAGYEHVIFFVGEDNFRSRRALEKIGARRTRRSHEVEVAGRTVRHLLYLIDREGFATGPLNKGTA